jgi:hypothetical protein
MRRVLVVGRPGVTKYIQSSTIYSNKSCVSCLFRYNFDTIDQLLDCGIVHLHPRLLPP